MIHFFKGWRLEIFFRILRKSFSDFLRNDFDLLLRSFPGNFERFVFPFSRCVTFRLRRNRFRFDIYRLLRLGSRGRCGRRSYACDYAYLGPSLMSQRVPVVQTFTPCQSVGWDFS